MKDNPAPYIAGLRSIKIETEPGTYLWCSCGLSKDQPFCDNSHIGTSFLPVVVTIDQRRLVKWCSCKHTSTPPFCDHSHRQLPGYVEKERS